ncbi:DUF305 domain-containing protein [Falsirhodobacter sp. 20TX0035]|uniref:DUF305 domain-containing protein n=1 Tax=Falsirhodobacter sp. 20TX0035 TaxID=3022019 RepID=UPI00232CD008|nr:DUF305 domain-containing protein [Falsirhodobacter sp. 20TX0035]MDB6453692.1 DUF305 domain-containing protein [Falsirhodobacter sp. 20TX0035]
MSIQKICPTVALAALLATPALAQSHADHSAPAAEPMAGYMETMDRMMESMKGMDSSGNADADFLLMMIPHHQSAVDMAMVELEHGKDQDTRAMAGKIIAAQEAEIEEMKAMLERMGVDAPE